jgi:DNA-binding CsgD family transcriptional regulator
VVNDETNRLLGRDVECAALDHLLADVRRGTSHVLVLRGEPGVGKSVLLDHLVRSSEGCQVLRCAGVEAEVELPYAGLQHLCAPLLGDISRLPVPQHDALATAFGLMAGDPPSRFLVGLALLTLLADAATARPVICVIDDAQWLDTASAQTLGFVARRLLAESVGIVLATRTLADDSALHLLPGISVGGLAAPDARTLLESAIPGRIDERVLDQIIAETGGNPLAMLELPRGLSVTQLGGGFATPDTRPLSSKIEASYQRQLEPLAANVRRLLLVAAAEPTGDRRLLRGAAQVLDIGAETESAAEQTGLIDFGSRVQFRHPLVRSSIHRAASTLDRREAHRALAAATDPDLDPDRRAWHRAHAAVPPDASVADDLERSADRARQRGGAAAAAAFLERAAALSPGPEDQARRSLLAAQAKFEAADPDAAQRLLAAAQLDNLDELQRALRLRLTARIAFAHRRGGDAPRLFLQAARALEPIDPKVARNTLLEAFGAASVAGPLGEPGLGEVAMAVRQTPSGPGAPVAVDLLVEALAVLQTEGRAVGVPQLHRAVTSFRAVRPTGRDEIVDWLGLTCPIVEEAAAHQTWDFEAWQDLAGSAEALARETGALAFLPVALVYSCGIDIHLGDFTGASAKIEEAGRITDSTGLAAVTYASLVLAGWRGDEATARVLIDATVADATERGEGLVLAAADFVTAVLYNGLGRYDEARVAAGRAVEVDELGFVGWALVEQVEACARSGADARDALARLEERTLASGTDWALGVLARSRALVEEQADPEPYYLEAIERLARSRVAVHLARAHLVYGEWLRRAQRRLEARSQLSMALDMFEAFGAQAFAARAHRELIATGATARRRSTDRPNALTPQETQIATLTAKGHTNSEIGSQLFISPRTVEYHLAKVFTKLQVRSRRELSRKFPVPPVR